MKQKVKKKKTKEELEKEIVTKIYKSIKEKKNELEIINSELFIIKENIKEQNNKEILTQQQKMINNLLKRISKIKSQLKIYEKDRVIDDAIYLDNKNVMDDILEYKKIIESKESLKKEYEIIEEYGFIIEEIDKIEDRCKELDKQTNTQLGLLEINEQDFLEIELKAIKEDENINSINDIVNEQIEIIKELEENVGIIETEKEIINNYDALNKLIKLELKYLALMSLSPLKGTLPYIAIVAAQTKETINLLSAGSLVTQEEKIKYITKDYTNQIENKEYTLIEVEEKLNDSICSISNIKEKIKNNDRFRNNPKYESLITKIETMEDYLIDNSYKIEIYKAKLKKSKTKNSDTLVKVLKLNEKE